MQFAFGDLFTLSSLLIFPNFVSYYGLPVCLILIKMAFRFPATKLCDYLQYAGACI